MTSAFVSRAHQWARTTLAVTVAGLAIGAAGAWHAHALPGGGPLAQEMVGAIVTIVPYGLVGAVLVDRRPDLPFGWLLAAGAALHTLYALAVLVLYTSLLAGRVGPVAAWLGLATSLGFVYLPIQGLVNVRFPSGRHRSRWGRWLEWAIVGGITVGVAASVLSTPVDRGSTSVPNQALVVNPLVAGGSPVSRVATQLLVVVPVVILLGGLSGLGIVVRFFRASGLERQQLKWRATHILVGLALFPLAVTQHLPLDKADNVAFVLTLAVPVLRYRLWAIDTIISRSVAYAAVTALLTALYAAVAVSGAAVATRALGSTVAVVAVVLAFGPVRRLVGLRVDRLFYGQRNEPYAALRLLGQRLRDVTTPGHVLPAVADAVATALRLPYAAIERADDGAVLAAAGQPGPTVDRWPLSFEGRFQGWLVASPRAGEERFDRRDSQLLDDVARQVASAVHADALTADLLRSRQELVTAREEERRRLRRDLHDGLGPVLTGAVLTMDAALSRLATDPGRADQLIVQAKTASNQALGDLRQVVYGLRPPALDDLGLLGALRVQADRLAAGHDLRVAITADDLPPLPAAVEVAAYRTVVEALTNAVRHGRAHACTVTLRAVAADNPSGRAGGGALEIEVTDDGGPSRGPWVPGVGLTAMRERAEELGGSITAGPDPARPDQGGRIAVRLPLPEEPGWEPPSGAEAPEIRP